MSNLQSVSIIAAFPIGAVIVLIVLSFMKDAKKFMEENEKQRKSKRIKREISVLNALLSFFL